MERQIINQYELNWKYVQFMEYVEEMECGKDDGKKIVLVKIHV